VAVKIKLKRLGKIHAPQYRIVIADSRTARNGRAIEEIGIYQPMDNPSVIQLDSERVQYWLGVGAQPTEAVMAILKVTGDWQRFKGLPGAEGTLEVAAPKESKLVAFEAAVQAAAKEPKSTPKPKLEKALEDVVEKVEEIAETAAHAVEDAVEKVEEAVHREKPAAEAAADEAPGAQAAEDGPAAEAADDKPAAEAADDKPVEENA